MESSVAWFGLVPLFKRKETVIRLITIYEPRIPTNYDLFLFLIYLKLPLLFSNNVRLFSRIHISTWRKWPEDHPGATLSDWRRQALPTDSSRVGMHLPPWKNQPIASYTTLSVRTIANVFVARIQVSLALCSIRVARLAFSAPKIKKLAFLKMVSPDIFENLLSSCPF